MKGKKKKSKFDLLRTPFIPPQEGLSQTHKFQEYMWTFQILPHTEDNPHLLHYLIYLISNWGPPCSNYRVPPLYRERPINLKSTRLDRLVCWKVSVPVSISWKVVSLCWSSETVQIWIHIYQNSTFVSIFVKMIPFSGLITSLLLITQSFQNYFLFSGEKRSAVDERRLQIKFYWSGEVEGTGP